MLGLYYWYLFYSDLKKELQMTKKTKKVQEAHSKVVWQVGTGAERRCHGQQREHSFAVGGSGSIPYDALK